MSHMTQRRDVPRTITVLRYLSVVAAFSFVARAWFAEPTSAQLISLHLAAWLLFAAVFNVFRTLYFGGELEGVPGRTGRVLAGLAVMVVSLALYYLVALLLPLSADVSREPIVWLLAIGSSLMFFMGYAYAMRMPPAPESHRD